MCTSDPEESKLISMAANILRVIPPEDDSYLLDTVNTLLIEGTMVIIRNSQRGDVGFMRSRET